MGKGKDEDPYSERPPDSDFQQQNLKAWQPLLTPGWVYGTFFIIGCIFIPIGLVIKVESDTVVQTKSVKYTSDGYVSIEIPEDMEPPIYFYYELDNFYQNHRRYVKSRSDEQLMGRANPKTDSCNPLETDTDSDKVLYPCGLIAMSYFNDEFTDPHIKGRADDSNATITWTEEGISWPSDEKKFQLPEGGDYPDTVKTYPDVTDEPFKVWMRTAALPKFKKLRYIIKDTTLNKGEVFKVKIKSNFNVTADGKKFVLLSTTSWLGGKNDFLGFAYIGVGSFCIFLALCFFLKHCISPRHLGDMRYLNFQNPSTQK